MIARRAMKPKINPTIGEAKRAMRIFSRPGTSMARHPAPTMTAPKIPPMSAWEELLGKPSHQVSRSQIMALRSAATITFELMAVASTTSCPMVVATATPKTNGPMKFATAVVPRAMRGGMAREEIIVATTLRIVDAIQEVKAKAGMIVAGMGVIDNRWLGQRRRYRR
jgi:hypothetical protein